MTVWEGMKEMQRRRLQMRIEEVADCACAFCPPMGKKNEAKESASESGSKFGWTFLRCFPETEIVCDEVFGVM